MRVPLKSAAVVLFVGFALCISHAQISQGRNEPRDNQGSDKTKKVVTHPAVLAVRTLSPDDRLSVMAAALDRKVRLPSGGDCSHLVHAVYERAGFPYTYASSDDLYNGIEGFQRVTRPESGDLVVWPGHVGIVIRPSRHIFFSFLSAGPGIDNYQASYWTDRGRPRFYRYIKNSPCPGCTLVRGKPATLK
jgi:cell wall-associated NlpC family hydrolase